MKAILGKIGSLTKKVFKPSVNNFFRLLVVLLVGAAGFGYYQWKSIQKRMLNNEAWVYGIQSDVQAINFNNYTGTSAANSSFEYTVLSTSLEKLRVLDSGYGNAEATYTAGDVLVVKIGIKNTSQNTEALGYSEILVKTANGELINANATLHPDDEKEKITAVNELAAGGTTESYLYFSTGSKKIVGIYIKPQNKTIDL